MYTINSLVSCRCIATLMCQLKAGIVPLRYFIPYNNVSHMTIMCELSLIQHTFPNCQFPLIFVYSDMDLINEKRHLKKNTKAALVKVEHEGRVSIILIVSYSLFD